MHANEAADYGTAVQQLYVAYFGRPADPGGLNNFSTALNAAGAPSDIQGLNRAYQSNATVRYLVDAFGTSAESVSLYPGDTNSFVTAIYRNVLNREPDSDGLAFWVDAIDRGGLTKGNAALSIMAGALANTTAQGRVDGAMVSNKIAAASSFTNSLDTEAKRSGYVGDAAAATARAVLAKVSDQTDLDSFRATIDASVAALAPTISTQATGDITPLLSMAGIWEPLDTVGGPIDFWNIARLGPDQLQGVVLAGWAYTGFSNTATDVTPVRAAVLAQRADGTLAIATDQYLPSAVTNGAGSVLIADFNEDGKDDIFLAAHNESPFVAKASTAYLSKPDGTFSRVVLNDSVMAHHASLATIDGKPTVLAASFNNDMANPIYTYNGQGGFDINNSSGFVAAMSVAAADFAGNGGTQVVYGDASWGLDIPYQSSNVMQQYLYPYVNGKLGTPKTTLPAPYFNDKPQYSQYVSNYGVSKTHNARLWTDDLNQDGRPDLIVGGEIWSAGTGLQKSIYQILLNNGGLSFSDQTDVLNPQYNQDAYYDYSLRMADIDQSGIKTYFAAQNSMSALVNNEYVPQKARHGNYILVNDGTGRLHVAMHDEFITMGDYVNRYLASRLGSNYFVNAEGDTPRFIPYQTASGKLNFLASVPLSQNVNGVWLSRFALVNVPLSIDLPSQYKENLIITQRNGSRNIRTFAGDDVIYEASDGGTCNIDGGYGTNTVVYSGKRSNYTITKTSNGYTVRDGVGSAGTDVLRRIQMLRFADMTVTLD